MSKSSGSLGTHVVGNEFFCVSGWPREKRPSPFDPPYLARQVAHGPWRNALQWRYWGPTRRRQEERNVPFIRLFVLPGSFHEVCMLHEGERNLVPVTMERGAGGKSKLDLLGVSYAGRARLAGVLHCAGHIAVLGTLLCWAHCCAAGVVGRASDPCPARRSTRFCRAIWWVGVARCCRQPPCI
jgi:hypothetical protein